MQTFARWVSTPENRSAYTAVQRVLACLCSRRSRREINPVFLHGPAGTGKTHLTTALVAELTRACPEISVTVLAAGDFRLLVRGRACEDAAETLTAARLSELLVIEDLQHLAPAGSEALVQL